MEIDTKTVSALALFRWTEATTDELIQIRQAVNNELKQRLEV